jgi:hypothetical protein
MIDYAGIVKTIADVLDENIDDAIAMVEPSEMGVSPQNEIGVFLNRQKSVEDRIGSSDPYMVTLEVTVLCSAYSPDGAYEASKERDALLGEVCDVLKEHRNLEGVCQTSQLGDIGFQTAQADAGFFSAAKLDLRVFMFT